MPLVKKIFKKVKKEGKKDKLLPKYKKLFYNCLIISYLHNPLIIRQLWSGF